MPDRTAEKLLAELKELGWIADPVAREAAFEAEHARLRAAEQPVLEALRQVGVKVPEIWSLVERKKGFPQAIPVLLEHLGRPYPAAVREAIARALATPDARPVWHTLAARYAAEADDWVKEALAAALSATVTDVELDALLDLLADPRHGTSRVLLVPVRVPVRALPALERLVDDPDLRLELPRVVKRLRARSRRGGEPTGTPPTPIEPGLREASAGLDRSEIGRQLSRLVELGLGITRAQATTIRRMIDMLELDEERELRFEIRRDGAVLPLVVRAYLDDSDAVDLYFFGPDVLIEPIQSAFETTDPS